MSRFTLTAITVGRYLALRLHLRYQELVTVKRISIVLLSIWTVGVLLFIWSMFHGVLSFRFKILIILTACILLTIWSYLTIFKTVRRHQAQIQAQVAILHNGELMSNTVRYRKSVFTHIVHCWVFMISYINPCLSVLTIFSLGVRVGIVIKETVFTLMFLNSCVNPVFVSPLKKYCGDIVYSIYICRCKLTRFSFQKLQTVLPGQIKKSSVILVK